LARLDLIQFFQAQITLQQVSTIRPSLAVAALVAITQTMEILEGVEAVEMLADLGVLVAPEQLDKVMRAPIQVFLRPLRATTLPPTGFRINVGTRHVAEVVALALLEVAKMVALVFNLLLLERQRITPVAAMPTKLQATLLRAAMVLLAMVKATTEAAAT
tara:strand:+ start:56 stop:535 length:480 start_codon:yes stop_codon:yes gene_type:complete